MTCDLYFSPAVVKLTMCRKGMLVVSTDPSTDHASFPQQIMLQFPLSFEFNDHFLSSIAYHHVSMRFRTFLLDSEHDRYESGWMTEEDCKPRGKSLWDYLDLHKNRSPLYYNFQYSPDSRKV